MRQTGKIELLEVHETFDEARVAILGPRASRPQPRAKFTIPMDSTSFSSPKSDEASKNALFALRAHCGRDARGPSKSLDAHWLLGFFFRQPVRIARRLQWPQHPVRPAAPVGRVLICRPGHCQPLPINLARLLRVNAHIT